MVSPDWTHTNAVLYSEVDEVKTTGDTPQTVWQLKTTGTNLYRASRLPSLYPGVQW
jgi:hypothetical protein